MAPTRSARTKAQQIVDHVVDAILSGEVQPGQRLGEQALADLFGVSRTVVREAMARLSARGMVQVDARRGWFVVAPSREEAKEAFDARVAIETGLLLQRPGKLPAASLKALRQHVQDEQAAIADGEPGRRSYLLGDFHVCLADCLGGALVADILRDLTARTTLIASLFQSTHDATESCADHARIVTALAAGDTDGAVALMRQHIGTVASHLSAAPAGRDDPLAGLRRGIAQRQRLFSDLIEPVAAAAGPADALTVSPRPIRKKETAR